MTDHGTIDRSALRFPEEVKSRFLFLESRDFALVRSEATIVRYESPLFGINIFFGRRSYEIGLEIASVLRPNEAYSISELLQLFDPSKGASYRNYATHSKEGVAEGVHQLADRLRQCIAAGMFDDKELFSRLQSQRSYLKRKYWLERDLEQARIDSESAWVKKDYEKVVEILSSLQEHLTPSELKKLEYARKHLDPLDQRISP